jgi:hypothetical protein
VNLGVATTDNSLALDFSQDGRTVSKENALTTSGWSLAQLIRDYSATPLNNDGTTWRFQIKLEDKPQNVSGRAQFEAKLINPRRALPEIKDWPKQ